MDINELLLKTYFLSRNKVEHITNTKTSKTKALQIYFSKTIHIGLTKTNLNNQCYCLSI